jgi:hypothetical protein
MRVRQKMRWRYTISWAMKFIYSLRTGVILKKVVLPLQRDLNGNARSCTSGQKNHRMMRKNELKSRNQGKTVAEEMTIEERIKQEEQVREKTD